MTATLVLALVPLLAGAATSKQDFETLYEWNLLSYDLPAESYIPQNNLFTGLEPYPSWEWQGTAGNCSVLVSVYRARVDRCNRLWALDSGVITTLDDFSPVCPPKILVFDLQTDSLIRSIILPRTVLRPNSLLTNLVIDYEVTGAGRGDGSFYGLQHQTQRTCDDAFLYITDTTSAAIIVYDVRRDAAWRVFDPSMLPHPDHSTHFIAGESFTLPDAVVGIALSPETDTFGAPPPEQQRVLYYQPFAALRLFSMPTSVLQTPPQLDTDLKVKLVFEKSSQSACLASDPIDGTLYFNPQSELAIASLRPGAPSAQIVVQDFQALQFSSDILVTPNDNYNIWFISSKLQKYFRQSYDPNIVNFRIMRISRYPYSPNKFFAYY